MENYIRMQNEGIDTGIKAVDEILDGMHKGELIVVGARPGIGKQLLY